MNEYLLARYTEQPFLFSLKNLKFLPDALINALKTNELPFSRKDFFFALFS